MAHAAPFAHAQQRFGLPWFAASQGLDAAPESPAEVGMKCGMDKKGGTERGKRGESGNAGCLTIIEFRNRRSGCEAQDTETEQDADAGAHADIEPGKPLPQA